MGKIHCKALSIGKYALMKMEHCKSIFTLPEIRNIHLKICYASQLLAVKFGRMSKKQREKVEDEVRLHKQLAEQQGGMAMLYQGPYNGTNGQ